jgi:hypothetical protein
MNYATIYEMTEQNNIKFKLHALKVEDLIICVIKKANVLDGICLPPQRDI